MQRPSFTLATWNAAVLALTASAGALHWKHTLEPPLMVSTWPRRCNPNGDPNWVTKNVSLCAPMDCADPATCLYQFSDDHLTTPPAFSHPVVGGGSTADRAVFVMVSFAFNLQFSVSMPDHQWIQSVRALNAGTGEVLWEFWLSRQLSNDHPNTNKPSPNPLLSAPTVVGGTVYVADPVKHAMLALNGSTGAVIWHTYAEAADGMRIDAVGVDWLVPSPSGNTLY